MHAARRAISTRGGGGLVKKTTRVPDRTDFEFDVKRPRDRPERFCFFEFQTCRNIDGYLRRATIGGNIGVVTIDRSGRLLVIAYLLSSRKNGRRAFINVNCDDSGTISVFLVRRSNAAVAQVRVQISRPI